MFGLVRPGRFVDQVTLSTVKRIAVVVVTVHFGRCVCDYSVQINDFFVSALMHLAGCVETMTGACGSPAMAVHLIVAVTINYRKEPTRKAYCGEAFIKDNRLIFFDHRFGFLYRLQWMVSFFLRAISPTAQDFSSTHPQVLQVLLLIFCVFFALLYGPAGELVPVDSE